MFVGLEAWLVEDGKVEPLKRGDVLVCGLEISVQQMSEDARAAELPSIQRVDGSTAAFYDVVGRAVPAEWFRGDMWLLESAGVQFAVAGPDRLPPSSPSGLRVRGSVWVAWRYLHHGPLTRPWRVDRIVVQTGSAGDSHAPLHWESAREGRRYEVDHIDRWPDGLEQQRYRYLLDLTPLEHPASNAAGVAG